MIVTADSKKVESFETRPKVKRPLERRVQKVRK
jgi:hypothetical protein